MNVNEMINVDLPSLQSILLGVYAITGDDNNQCSLIMRSNGKKVDITECRSSKSIFY